MKIKCNIIGNTLYIQENENNTEENSRSKYSQIRNLIQISKQLLTPVLLRSYPPTTLKFLAGYLKFFTRLSYQIYNPGFLTDIGDAGLT
jgi:hypothetical protein